MFLGITSIYLALFVYNDWVNVVDECLVSYAAIVVLCVVNVTLFGLYWWWTGRATAVYRWVMVLQAGMAATNAVNFAYRYQMLCSNQDFAAYVHSTDFALWRYRTVPETVALIYMLALIVARLCCSRMDNSD